MKTLEMTFIKFLNDNGYDLSIQFFDVKSFGFQNLLSVIKDGRKLKPQHFCSISIVKTNFFTPISNDALFNKFQLAQKQIVDHFIMVNNELNIKTKTQTLLGRFGFTPLSIQKEIKKNNEFIQTVQNLDCLEHFSNVMAEKHHKLKLKNVTTIDFSEFKKETFKYININDEIFKVDSFCLDGLMDFCFYDYVHYKQDLSNFILMKSNINISTAKNDNRQKCLLSIDRNKNILVNRTHNFLI